MGISERTGRMWKCYKERDVFVFWEINSNKDYYAYLKYAEQKQIVDDYYSLLPQFPDEEQYENLEVCDMIE